MKIKRLPFVAFAVALILCFSAGLMAAPLEHDVSEGSVVLTDGCGSECPGHIITGESMMIEYNIQILSGSHKITLDNVGILMAQTQDKLTEPDVVQEHSALYIAEGVENVDVTLVGDVLLNGAYGIYSLADNICFTGDETTSLYVGTSLDAGCHVDGNLTLKGGNFEIDSGGVFSPEIGLLYRYALAVSGTLTVEDAVLDAYGRNVTEYDGTVPEDVAICGICAHDMDVINSEVGVYNNDITVAEGYDGAYRNIALYVKTLDVENSVLEVNAGAGSHSFGICCEQLVNIAGSEVTAEGGTATRESIGLEAWHAYNAYAYESTLELIGGESGYISAGGEFTMLQTLKSIVYGYGGEAKRHSLGLTGNYLWAENSDVRGYGGIATDTEVIDNVGVFSEGLYFISILGGDSEVYGEAEKAMCSIGISATEVSIDGGLICGMGFDEIGDGGYSFGIDLTPYEEKWDNGTVDLITTKFEIVNGNVVAIGDTQGLHVEGDFDGVSYKKDDSATAEVNNDLSPKEFYFGNKYKMLYNANGMDAKNMPANAEYYLDETFLLSKEVPTAEGYEFLYWCDSPDGAGVIFMPEDDNYFGMNNEGYELYAIWRCDGSADCPLRAFSDLDPEKWYHDGICFCLEYGLMYGTGKTTFEPDTAATRAMIVATLYRLDGEPEMEGESGFTDVKDGAWYEDAVVWAAENGIASGYPDGTFAPNKIATREEVVVFLYRMFTDYYGLSARATRLPDTFTDKDNVSSWALDAMEWAFAEDIIKGVSEDTLAPKETSTRAQLAAMLERFQLSLISEE